MSTTDSSSRLDTCSDLLGAAAAWSRAHRRDYFLFSLAGAALAGLVHLFGPRVLPAGASNWFLRLDFGTPAAFGRAILFWFLLSLLLAGLAGFVRLAGFKALGAGSAAAARGWRHYVHAEPGGAFRAICLGLALGFLLVAFFDPTDAPSPFATGVYAPAPLQVVAILLLLALAGSKLSELTARSFAKRRTVEAGSPARTVPASQVSLVFAACALPLIATLPVGTWLATTRVSVLLAILGGVVWLSTRSRPGTAGTWLVLLGAAALLGMPQTLLAEDGLYADPTVRIAKEEWVNAFLCFAVSFAGAGAGAALGHALAEAGVVHAPAPAPVSEPAPTPTP